MAPEMISGNVRFRTRTRVPRTPFKTAGIEAGDGEGGEEGGGVLGARVRTEEGIDEDGREHGSCGPDHARDIVPERETEDGPNPVDPEVGLESIPRDDPGNEDGRGDHD